MNEQELRGLVRQAIARHQQGKASSSEFRPGLVTQHLHPSHGMFALPADARAGDRCLIEPKVACTHCGYCKSYGH